MACEAKKQIISNRAPVVLFTKLFLLRGLPFSNSQPTTDLCRFIRRFSKTLAMHTHEGCITNPRDLLDILRIEEMLLVLRIEISSLTPLLGV